MLWSLVKILVFVTAVAAAALGAVQLLGMEDSILVTFGGREYELNALQSVMAVLVLGLLGWLFVKLLGLVLATLKYINGDETAISRYAQRNRERKGYKALSEGLMALASGEGRAAMTKAAQAERFLQRPELTNLISAQAAEMSGDTKKAAQVYKELLKNKETRFVGVRGIMKQKLAEGDTDTALALAEKAFAIKPKHEETQDTLLRLQAQKEDWEGARDTLGAKLKYGTLPRDVHRRRDAVLAISEAKDKLTDGDTEAAYAAAIEANRMSPELIPAAVMAADAYVVQGKPKYATRVIKKAWEAMPHPDLAAAFAAIAPDENGAARLKRFEQLTRAKPDHAETKMLLAELNIAAEDFPAARKALGALVENTPTARALTIMAAIERGEGADDAIVRGWLTRALTAPRGPQWVCDVSQTPQSTWTPTSEGSGAFDTLSWREPPNSEMSMPNSTEMLPLLVGAKDDEVEEIVAEATDISPEEEAKAAS